MQKRLTMLRWSPAAPYIWRGERFGLANERCGLRLEGSRGAGGLTICL